MKGRKAFLAAVAFTSMTVPVISFSSRSALAGQDIHFKLINETTYTLVRFYASPTGIRVWEKDILGKYMLPPGSSANININDGRDVCNYDIKAVFSDGTPTIKYRINFCDLDGGTYTFTEE